MDWRASLWSKRGGKETEDLHGYHDALKAVAIAKAEASDGASRAAALKLSQFDSKGKIQPTWGPLIRVILALHGKSAERQGVKDFQRCELGREDGENCVLDLSALSSPSKSARILDGFGYSWLRKEEKEASLIWPRCDSLRVKLTRHKPSLVLFYGLDEKRYWERISAQQFSPSKKLGQLWLAGGESTLFAMMPHPVNLNTRLPEKGPGAVKTFLAAVGSVLREELSQP